MSEKLEFEKVDELIRTLCDYTSEQTKRNDLEAVKDVTECTYALAALITARAQ